MEKHARGVTRSSDSQGAAKSAGKDACPTGHAYPFMATVAQASQPADCNRGLTRRGALRAAIAAPFVMSARSGSSIRVESVAIDFEEFLYRAPYVFGGRAVDRATILNVHTHVRARDGRTARGFGSMPLGNQWSFPSSVMSYETTLGAMKRLAEEIRKITVDSREYGHPLDLNQALEAMYLRAATAISKGLAEPIPKLCTLVTASPFDAAIHDAYGKVHGLSCYDTYGARYMTHDLSAYLGLDFRGEYLDRYLQSRPTSRIRLFHSVGAGDPIEKQDVRKPVGDGLPEHLAEWIAFNGLTRIKIKLNGADLKEDVERTVRIDRVASATRQVDWSYCLDFNERCRNVGYLLDFLHQVKEQSPAGFARILYIEQPTARDLKADRANVMHEAAKLRPVVIDESLTDLESLLLAREMGYTGIALKACKGQSQAMLMAAAGQKYKMFLTVQDLTCPGASLVQSGGIAAHVPGVAGLEANSRQYMPAANKPWESRFPGLFHITDGTLDTSSLTMPGLGVAE
jgi:L-alanine-DL-glutamate epimerase-like enolase superfamily enzyme